ncbi:MAG: hypothetical protein NC914_01220 [Candidatus Omnitrophica bacterium]|nr:hypothetical protein [Candidatus Omnitrophota bacterium]
MCKTKILYLSCFFFAAAVLLSFKPAIAQTKAQSKPQVQQKNTQAPSLSEAALEQIKSSDAKTRTILEALLDVQEKISAQQFYQKLAAQGISIEDVNKVKTDLSLKGGNALVGEFFGKSVRGQSSPVEQKILTYRKSITEANLKKAVKNVMAANPAKAKVYIGKVGKWAKQKQSQLTLDGDIDINLVTNDKRFASAVAAEFERLMQADTGMDTKALDSILTVHGRAGAEVYIDRWGKEYAEDQLRKGSLELVNASGETLQVSGEHALKMIAAEMEIKRMMAGKKAVIAQAQMLRDPGLSLEMIRHADADIIKKMDVRLPLTNIVKLSKYLERSNDALEKTAQSIDDAALRGELLSADAEAKRLAEFAKEITQIANTTPVDAADDPNNPRSDNFILEDKLIDALRRHYAGELPADLELKPGPQGMSERAQLLANQFTRDFSNKIMDAMVSNAARSYEVRLKIITRQLDDAKRISEEQVRKKKVEEAADELSDLKHMIDAEAEVFAKTGVEMPQKIKTQDASLKNLEAEIKNAVAVVYLKNIEFFRALADKPKVARLAAARLLMCISD